jgi:hypothetical protein
MIWKDGTSYSQGDEERIPTLLKCKIKTLEIIVHRIHGIPGWYLTCRYLESMHIKDHRLNGEDLESCKHQSIAIIKKALYDKAQEIQGILIDIEEF